MNFKMSEAIEVLERTPPTLECFLSGLSDEWLKSDEGEGTWNVAQVVEHLIEGEKTNWIPRLTFILQEGEDKPFPEFDRFSHLRKEERSIDQKLQEFRELRTGNLATLIDLVNSEAQLEKTGSHPAFGTVRARELISTWVAHDLTHLAQIVRCMAERYRIDVGPWRAYLGILNRGRS